MPNILFGDSVCLCATGFFLTSIMLYTHIMLIRFGISIFIAELIINLVLRKTDTFVYLN